jgi:YggT family protein
MQLTRADFRNPIGRAIVQLTDPLVRPLRRVLPPAGKIDTASVVALLLFGAIKLWVLYLLFQRGVYPPLALLVDTGLDLIHLVLNTYLFSIVLNAILSFVAPGKYSPAQSLLASICDPVLNPIRRVIPSPTGLDLSPLWAILAIQALLIVLR